MFYVSEAIIVNAMACADLTSLFIHAMHMSVRGGRKDFREEHPYVLVLTRCVAMMRLFCHC
jgi:hypothetical protein